MLCEFMTMVDVRIPLNRSCLSINFTDWNVKGLNDPIKCSRFLTHLENLKTDIAFLTETHMCSSDYVRLKRGWIEQVFYSHSQGLSTPTRVFIKP